MLLLQIDYLTSIGLKQDEVCNMASISVVLLGLNPETRLRTVVDYLKSRGVQVSEQIVFLFHIRSLLICYKSLNILDAASNDEGGCVCAEAF